MNEEDPERDRATQEEEEEEDARAHTHERSPNVDEAKEEGKGVRGSTCIRHVVDDFHEKLHVPVHEHAMTTSQT